MISNSSQKKQEPEKRWHGEKVHTVAYTCNWDLLDDMIHCVVAACDSPNTSCKKVMILTVYLVRS